MSGNGELVSPAPARNGDPTSPAGPASPASPASEDQKGAGRMPQIYAAVVVVEILVLLGLWAVAQHFGS